MSREPEAPPHVWGGEREERRCTARPGLLVLLILCSFACGPDSSARVQAKGEETIVRTLRFVTVRNKTENAEPGKIFGDGRGPVRTGIATVTWSPSAFLEALSRTIDHHASSGSAALKAIDEVDEESFWREVEAIEGEARPVLYVHGYKIDFERGSKRAAQLQENLSLQGRFLWFSWPSDGAALNYTIDETDLFWSIPYLAGIVDRLGEIFGDGGFDVVAHSLGTRGAVQALLRRAASGESQAPRVNQLVLAAPDMDAGIFHEDVHRLRPLAKGVTVYASSDDAALSLSAGLHGYPRLGQVGPHLEGLAGIEIIDVSQLDLRHPSGHVYHLYHDAVTDDLDQLLNEGKSAAERSGLRRTNGAWRLEGSGD